MTEHYELVKKYHKGEDIVVDKYWFDKFQKGETSTLLHRVGIEFVIMVPPIKDYKHYQFEEMTIESMLRYHGTEMIDRR